MSLSIVDAGVPFEHIARTGGDGVERAVQELAHHLSGWVPNGDAPFTGVMLVTKVVAALFARMNSLGEFDDVGVRAFEAAVSTLADVIVPQLFPSKGIYGALARDLAKHGVLVFETVLTLLEQAHAIGLLDIFWRPALEAQDVAARLHDILEREREIIHRMETMEGVDFTDYRAVHRDWVVRLERLERRAGLRHAFAQAAVAMEQRRGHVRARVEEEPGPREALPAFLADIQRTTAAPDGTAPLPYRAGNEYSTLVGSFLGGRRRR